MKFQKSRVVLFSIEKGATFRIWRKSEVVEKIERTALYKVIWTVVRAIQVYEKKIMYEKGIFSCFYLIFLLVNYNISLLVGPINRY